MEIGKAGIEILFTAIIAGQKEILTGTMDLQ
jgi:hypothetical protein